MKNSFTNIYTIGFTEKPAAYFFPRLKVVGVTRVIDIRLHPNSQLAGYAKQDHLTYFLPTLVGAEYIHMPILAPTPELFTAYKRNGGSWETYRAGFLQLMQDRRIEDSLDPGIFDNACLLCSEHQPHFCHRRLVGEYLQAKWGNTEVTHLV